MGLALALLAALAVPVAMAQDPPDDDAAVGDPSRNVTPNLAADALHALQHATGQDLKPTGPAPANPPADSNKTSQPGVEPEAEPPAPRFPSLSQDEAEKKFDPTDDPNRDVIKCPDGRVLIVEGVPAPPEAVNAPLPPGEGYDAAIDPCNPPEGP